MFTHFLRKAALVAGAAVLCLISVAPAMAATSNDRVPSTVQSCTSDATTGRNTLPFDCSETATKWVIGTAPTLSCYAGASVPTCGANQDFLCNTGACVCRSGFTMCGATSTCVANVACSGGQTFDACAGACVGNIGVTLQSGTGTRQGASGTNATISVHGNLDIAGGGTAGDIYMSSGRDIFVNGAATTDLTVLNDTAGQLFNFNIGSTTRQGNLNAFGDVWVDDSDTLGKGIQLEAADRPLITRNWDAFTSGAYSGVGRWGLFMEPNYLTVGVPNTASRGFRVRSFNADSTAVDRLTVDASTGAVGIGGALSVNGLTTFNGGLRLPTGAGAGRVLTSDASGNATWVAGASGLGGTGAVNTVPKFTAASTLGNAAIVDDGTEVMIGRDAGIGASAAGSGGVLHVAANASGSVSTLALFSSTASGATGVVGTGSRIVLTSNNSTSRGVGITALNTGGSNNAHDLILETNPGSNPPTERMRITSGGNVGIGTSAPGALLDVNGAIRSGYNADTASVFGRAAVGNCGTADVACFAHLDVNNATSYALEQSAVGATRLNAASGQTLSLGIADSNRLVISSTGNMVNVVGMTTATDGIALGGKLGISGGYGTDTWLRLNQSSAFTSGVYTPANLRVDGALYLSSSRYLNMYNSSWMETNAHFWARGTAIQADEGVYAYATTAANALLATSNSAATWAAGIVGNMYTSDNGFGQDGTIFVGGGVAVAKDISIGGKHAFRGNDTWLRLNQDQAFGNGVYVRTRLRADGDFELNGKVALRGTDTWLRLNQDGEFTSGVHTPYFLNAGSMTVGNNYSSPGDGNLEVQNGISSTTMYASRTFPGPSGGNTYPTTYRVELSAGVHNSAMSSYVFGNSLADHNNQAAGLFVNSQNNSYPNVTTSSGVYTLLAYWNGSGSKYALYSNAGTVTNGSSFPSSKRWKHDVVPLENPLEKLLKMRGVNFTWNADAPFGSPNERDIGVIAEEIQAQYPMLVELDETGKPFAVDYAKLTPVLIEATRELNDKITEQQGVIDALEARLLKLEAKLTK